MGTVRSDRDQRHDRPVVVTYPAPKRLRRSDWLSEVKPEFRDEFFDEEGDVKCGSGNVDLVKALLAGRDILRSK